MASIHSVILEVPDPEAARAFHAAAFGADERVQFRASEAPTSGFRGFTLSLIVAQPSTADSFLATAIEAGATTLKPGKKSFWGYGGVVQAPDGTIWKVASQSKKDSGPATREIEDIVLLLGVDDVKASKRFYVDQGLSVRKSFLNKYVEFETPASGVNFSLYSRGAAAKDAGVSPEGSGSHRLVIVGDAGTFTDPDGFEWETASA